MGGGDGGGGWGGGVPWMICWSGFMGAMVARRGGWFGGLGEVVGEEVAIVVVVVWC